MPNPKRIIWTVRWNSKEGFWQVRRSDRVVANYTYKSGAVRDATSSARYAWTIHAERSQVRIYKKNGRIQEERTYGFDPRRYKG